MEKVEIGGATLYRADCQEALPHIGLVDALITDPPYGLAGANVAITWGETKDWADAAKDWDSTPPQDIVAALIARYPKCLIWGGNYFALPPSRCWLIWDKPDRGLSMADAELAWTNLDKNVRSFSISRNPDGKREHPTQKPLALMAWCIEQLGIKAGQTILDPFMGSGTTGVAAVQMGCKFIGVERDPQFFDVACKRIERAVSQGQLFAPEPAMPVQAQTALFEPSEPARKPARARRKTA